MHIHVNDYTTPDINMHVNVHMHIDVSKRTRAFIDTNKYLHTYTYENKQVDIYIKL